jgi:hypothetical protein
MNKPQVFKMFPLLDKTSAEYKQAQDIKLLEMFYEQFDTDRQNEILSELKEGEEVIDYMRAHYTTEKTTGI